MALIDVSRAITLFQRLCQFAEEFTVEFREPLVAALMNLFQSDLEEGQTSPDVGQMVDSLIRRLRRTLVEMTQAETELLGAFKENIAFRDLRDKLLAELRVVFDRARIECRNHFTRPVGDAAGFPARIADDSGALLRQTKLVSWTLRRPDFDLGEAVIPKSTVTAESILEIYEPKAQELETALSDRVRRRARARGKQVEKDQMVADFRTTYSIFVGLLRGSFRLAGQNELAKRLTLIQIGTGSSPSQASQDTSPQGTVPLGGPRGGDTAPVVDVPATVPSADSGEELAESDEPPSPDVASDDGTQPGQSG